MAKLGPYSYPDIRFGDAVEIAGRILSKFRGVVSVKGLAWELGMAEGSGTLFAKVAALRDFGLVEGRGELRVAPLAQRVLHPANSEEGRRSRAEAFRRVDLLRRLHERFQGEVPDDMGLLIALEELTKAPREEIIRRAGLIQKHLADAARVLSRPAPAATAGAEHSGQSQQTIYNPLAVGSLPPPGAANGSSDLYLLAGTARLMAPLTPEYVEAAIGLLQAVKARLEQEKEGTPRETAQPPNSQEARAPAVLQEKDAVR